MELTNLKERLEALEKNRNDAANSGLDTFEMDKEIQAIRDKIENLENLQEQEEEVQATKLPYDFEELFGEEGHPVPKLNEMIIEVVKDTRRQANIEKNQELDEQKSVFANREGVLQSKIEIMKNVIENGTRANEELTREIGDVRTYLQQVNLERDDAFNKRDAAFRQLEEANEIIKGLKVKLENAATPTQSFDISPSDKLSKMVKESLDEKVARGLARFNMTIPVVASPEINYVTETVEATPEIPFQENQASEIADNQGNTSLEGNQSLDESLGQNESEVVTRAEFNALSDRVAWIEARPSLYGE